MRLQTNSVRFFSYFYYFKPIVPNGIISYLKHLIFMKVYPFFIVLLLPFFFATTLQAQNSVVNYGIYYAAANYDEQDIITLRKFERKGQKYFLAVDTKLLNTQIIPATGINEKAMSLEQISKLYKDSPYIKALSFVKTQSFALQDAGIIHGYPKEKGVTLTIDLCPSHKPLDRELFSNLINEFGTIEKPVPVALSLSGRFMLTHGEDIIWLQSLEQKGEIKITWINHTYNHHYDPNAPLDENFLLKPGTDVDFEILGTEIAMIEHGLLPSVFFRFPGLVSDNSVIEKVTAYGLIPIGSDAWLAKGQHTASGSIVLIHGNGNEPIGVNDFLKLLKSEKNSVMQKQWLLYDRESIGNEFKN